MVVDDGVTPYYVDQDGQWGTTATEFRMASPVGQNSVVLTTAPTPIQGAATIIIYALASGSSTFSDEVTFDYINISSEETNPAEGVEHNGERVANPSSFTRPTQELTIGVYGGKAYLGTFYRNDGTTDTDEGYIRPTSAFAFPLYQCNVIDRLFLRAKPSRIFEGGVYGFVPYNALVTIDGFSGVVWVVHGWSWDTKENLIEIKLFELHWDTDMLDDTLYEKIINYGNAIEPKIKG